MSSSLPDDLAEAVVLLRARRMGEARALLIDSLGRHPRADQGRFLLSLAVDDPSQQRDCLQRALQINPQHANARERLAELNDDAPLPAAAPALAPLPPAAAVAPAPTAPPTRTPARALTGGALWSLLGLGSLTALVCAATAGLYWAGYFDPTPPPPPVVVVQGPVSTAITFPTLPPAWTPSPVPSATPRPTETPLPTETPTPTLTPTPSLPPPDATLASAMDKIAAEVSGLRGLTMVGENARYLVPRSRVEELLRGLVLSPALRAELEDQQLVLSALGLVNPTYDLVNYALNSHADNIGGFYVPWTQAMYVIGSDFGGAERFVYSHEYNHALTDAHFNIAGLGVYPVCAGEGQRCSAIRALVEGDATFLMEQWWQQYATPQDILDMVGYEPPGMAVPEEFPPPYIVQDLAFPYNQGYEFVSYLHARGNWDLVNRAYADLPRSTEQILHPEKYLAGEAPLEVALPSQPALGEGWRLVDDDVLGEWLTYLILGYSADLSAQLPDEQAHAAAEGWGGDHYQVYHEAATGATVLVARWSWDTPRDGEEFAQALRAYQAQRFGGATVDRTDGACWEANSQASCLFNQGSEALWLLAPDQTVLNHVLLEFPDF